MSETDLTLQVYAYMYSCKCGLRTDICNGAFELVGRIAPVSRVWRNPARLKRGAGAAVAALGGLGATDELYRPNDPSPRHITLSEARSRLYQRRSLQVNSSFSAFFKIYKIFTILRRSSLKILQNFVKTLVILKKVSQILQKFAIFSSKSRKF